MEDRGIDLQILSIRPVSMLHVENRYISIPWARVHNNVMAEAISRHPDRFRGLATLPQGAEMEAWLDELERGIKELGMVGAIVNPNPKGTDAMEPLDDPFWEPLWEKAIELDAPLFLHGAYLVGPRYLRNRTAYLVGQTIEESISGPTLVYGGVLEKFPSLKLILYHGGGATPYQIGRHLTPPGRGEAGMFGAAYSGSFLDGYRKLYFDGTLYTQEALELLIKVVGPDPRLVRDGNARPRHLSVGGPDAGRPASRRREHRLARRRTEEGHLRGQREEGLQPAGIERRDSGGSECGARRRVGAVRCFGDHLGLAKSATPAAENRLGQLRTIRTADCWPRQSSKLPSWAAPRAPITASQ